MRLTPVRIRTKAPLRYLKRCPSPKSNHIACSGWYRTKVKGDAVCRERNLDFMKQVRCKAKGIIRLTKQAHVWPHRTSRQSRACEVFDCLNWACWLTIMPRNKGEKLGFVSIHKDTCWHLADLGPYPYGWSVSVNYESGNESVGHRETDASVDKNSGLKRIFPAWSWKSWLASASSDATLAKMSG